MPLLSCQAPSEPRPLPEVSLFCERSELPSVNGPSDCSQEPSAGPEVTDKHAAGRGVRVSAPKRTVVPVALEDVAVHEVSAYPGEGEG